MASSLPAQYQHFVPQFLLRNFAHPYAPEGEDHMKKKDRKKRKYQKGMYPGDSVVRNIDLRADLPVICEKPVKRILGLMNMYDDTTKSGEKQRREVEQMFSKLEAQACQVFRKITKAFEQKEPGVWMDRAERDLLRKFLFIQKYRGLTFHRRFNHENVESYDADDWQSMREYMAERGFARPMDVWLDNIKAIIEQEMDLEGKWLKELGKRMYFDDALWFWTHERFYYTAICTTSDPGDEFVLTDISYNIFEGPNSLVQDESGKVEGSTHTPLHEFGPVSPKIMIVLRSHIFPNPIEDAEDAVRESRAFRRYLALGGVYDYKTQSLLPDLPVAKAQNTYSQIVDGRLELLPGENGRKKQHHRFYFEFFRLSSDHVHKINAILLDNCAPCTSVVFKSTQSFAQTLEYYLTAPCTLGKRAIIGEEYSRKDAIMKLESVSRQLGSKKETVLMEFHAPPAQDYMQIHNMHAKRMRDMKRMILSELPTGDKEDILKGMIDHQFFPASDNPLRQLYCSLGGSKVTIDEDTSQGDLMRILRIKIDAWSQGVNESIRQRNRELLTDAYLRLPSRRVWIYTKLTVLMHLLYKSKSSRLEEPEITIGQSAEDVIVRGKLTVPPLNTWDETLTMIIYSRAVIKPEMFNRLIYNTGMVYAKIATSLPVDIWSETQLCWSVENHYLLKMVTFHMPGSAIQNCGIAEVEKLAKEAHRDIVREGRHRKLSPRPWFLLLREWEMIEILTRGMVRGKFDAALNGKLEKGLLKELKKVLFESSYLTPPDEWMGHVPTW